MATDSTGFIATTIEPARAKMASTLKSAAASTGANFEYLVSAAKMESNLNPSAAASTSSARGLFQFIEQTWLGTVKEAGALFGLGKFADAITKNASGSYSVSDPAARVEILKLRNDPAASAAMAGVLTQSNSFKLTGALGRRPTDGELYIAHVMGAGGARKLISNAEDNPARSGASLFPAAAAANRSIFYNRDGSARSVKQVYGVLTARYADAANSQAAQTVIAAGGGAQPSRPVAVAAASAPAAPDNAAYLSAFPQVGAQTAAAVPRAANQEPMFRTLFQVGERADPVSPAVQKLWVNGPRVAASRPDNSARPLDLFSDRDGTFSG